MLTPLIEIMLFLSSTFLLGLALGWVLWHLGAQQQVSKIASERDYWKKNFDQARVQNEPSQEVESPQAVIKPRPRHAKSRARWSA